MRVRIVFAVVAIVTALQLVSARQTGQDASPVTYRGDAGPGAGKRVVLLAGDQEYRSEETLPALARILARRFGFTSTVVFTTTPETGVIDPDSSHVTGLDVLRDADLLAIFTRFRDFSDDQMRHVADYLARGGPVVGLRTATHAFQIARADAAFRQYSWDDKERWPGGFGRQVLGETWVSHYGTNHRQSSRLELDPGQLAHPILRGVRDVWVQSGGYTADPMPGSTILARGRILDGMRADAPPAPDKQVMPVAWTRTYTGASGRAGRVFTTTHGASVDLLNVGFRRLLVNACLWAVGLDDRIQADANVDVVGPFDPSDFAFGGGVKGMRPAAMAGWESPIPARTAGQER